MSWGRASTLAVAIFAYFVVATVWLPDFLLRLKPVAGADPAVRDLIGAGSWFIGLVLGMLLLRVAQRRGAI